MNNKKTHAERGRVWRHGGGERWCQIAVASTAVHARVRVARGAALLGNGYRSSLDNVVAGVHVVSAVLERVSDRRRERADHR